MKNGLQTIGIIVILILGLKFFGSERQNTRNQQLGNYSIQCADQVNLNLGESVGKDEVEVLVDVSGANGNNAEACKDIHEGHAALTEAESDAEAKKDSANFMYGILAVVIIAVAGMAGASKKS